MNVGTNVIKCVKHTSLSVLKHIWLYTSDITKYWTSQTTQFLVINNVIYAGILKDRCIHRLSTIYQILKLTLSCDVHKKWFNIELEHVTSHDKINKIIRAIKQSVEKPISKPATLQDNIISILLVVFSHVYVTNDAYILPISYCILTERPYCWWYKLSFKEIQYRNNLFDAVAL